MFSLLGENAGLFVNEQISVHPSDDPRFVEILNSLVSGLVRHYVPESLFIVQINNWFDHKWLHFSGTGVRDWAFLGSKSFPAKTIYHQGSLTLPPFVPTRILSQRGFVQADDQYVEAQLQLPHQTEKQPSELNLHKHLDDLYGSSLLLWYSSNSSTNSRASVMAYSLAGDKTDTWYASFARKDAWQLQSSKGIDRDRLLGMMEI
jgi:hypothetical protein